MKIKRSIPYKLSLLFLFLLALFTFFSPIRVLPFFNQLWALCLILWLITSFLDEPYYFSLPSKYRFFSYLYVIYVIGIAYLMGNDIIGNRFFELSQLPLFYIAYHKNSIKGKNKDNWTIIKLLIPFVVVSSIITIVAYSINPYISRSLKVSQEQGLDYMKYGVGGYEFIYFLVTIFPVLLYGTFHKIKIKRASKVFLVFCVILFAINIILSNYATALLLCVLTVIIKLFGKNIKKSFLGIYAIVMVMIGIVTKAILPIILDVFIGMFDEGMNKSRLLEVKSYLTSGEEGISMEGRSNAYEKSLEVFFDYPLFGKILEPTQYNIYGDVIGFGQHSQIFDTLALYGIFIFVLQLFIYISPFLKRLFQANRVNSFTLCILTVFLILITLNNATPSIGLAVFFIFPTIFELIHKKTISYNASK